MLIYIADRIDRSVTLDIACLCERFSDENSYLQEVLRYLLAVKRKPAEYVERRNIEKNLHPGSLSVNLTELEGYVRKVLETPIEKRGITYEVHEFEMPRGDYITDLTHFIDNSGEIVKSMPRAAREKAGFFTLLVVDAATSSDDYELKTGIRCFKPDCEGTIFIRMPEDSGIEWHCLMCGVSGIINNWQGSKWDNSIHQ